jgi:hypothetical protein
MDTIETYVPITNTEILQGSRRLLRRQLATPGLAAVFHREGYPLKVVWPIRRADHGQESRWLQSYDTVFQVDVGHHQLGWDLTVPSEEETLGLRTRISFSCHVEDPAIIVERKIEDVKGVLEPLLLPRIREAGRSCSVEHCDVAERTIRDALPDPMIEEGFRLRHFTVTVTPDEAARRHLDERRQEAEHDRRKKEEAAEAEQKKQDKLAEEERRRKSQREDVRHDVQFYADLLGRADASTMWAILLAQDPTAAGQLVDRFNRQVESRQDLAHKLLSKFLEGHGMQDYQVEQAVVVLWDLLMQETDPNRVLRNARFLNGSSEDTRDAPPPTDEHQEDASRRDA